MTDPVYVEQTFLRDYSHGEKLEAPTIYQVPDRTVSLQFCGWEIVLLPNGKYYFNDTSGG